MKDIYKDYFQKSQALLYPLLGFVKKDHIKPLQTYLVWSDLLALEDPNIVCVYDTTMQGWEKFEKDKLLMHPMLEKRIPVGKTTVAYIFGMYSFVQDYKYFLLGKYSKFSIEAKKALLHYYGITSANWVYIESFVFPERYFEKYAEILDTDVSILREVGELCDHYNLEREVCPYSIPACELQI